MAAKLLENVNKSIGGDHDSEQRQDELYGGIECTDGRLLDGLRPPTSLSLGLTWGRLLRGSWCKCVHALLPVPALDVIEDITTCWKGDNRAQLT